MWSLNVFINDFPNQPCQVTRVPEMARSKIFWVQTAHSLQPGLRSRSRSRKESEVLGGVGAGFITTLGFGVGFFVRLRLWMSNWIIFKITLLNWEFLLKWYNFTETDRLRPSTPCATVLIIWQLLPT